MGNRSTDKLVAALQEAGAPADMVIRATGGAFHDFESRSATPIVDLVRECTRLGLHGVAERARNGDFDATREESDRWMKSGEGIAAMRVLSRATGGERDA
jgi:hypothetical protein